MEAPRLGGGEEKSAAASDRPARPARPGYTAPLLMWPGCLWETHKGGEGDTRGARESPGLHIPAHRRRKRRSGGSSVRKEQLSFFFYARPAALLRSCLPALRTGAGAGGEKVIRLTCDLMGDGSVREASDREGKIHQAGLASSVRGLRASLSLAAAALRGKILRVVDLHDNAAPERINCRGMGGNPPRL